MSPIKFVPLGELATLQAGVGFPLELQGRRNGTYPVAKVGDISRGGRSGQAVLSSADHYVDVVDLERLRAKPVPEGSILFAKIGEAISQNHRVIAGCDMLIDNNAMAAIPGPGIASRYLYYYLRTVDFYRLASATTVPALRKSELEKVAIPLLPLAAQGRIAEVLDRAEALRANRRDALAQLDILARANFDDLFTKGLDGPAVDISKERSGVPAGWSWELLTDVAQLATGHTPDRERGDYWQGHIPWISLTDIRDLDGAVANRTIQSVTALGIENSSAVLLPAGTVCFSRTASVGFVTVMGREMATSQDFVNWVCGPRLDPTYLMWALIGARTRLRALSSGSTHKTVYVRVVEGFRVLVPPLALQHAFAKRVAAVEKVKIAHRASLAEMDNLFSALQHRAFRGEL